MEASLQEILDAREQRAQTQKQLLARFQKPLLCFTMNIPGPVKLDRDIAIGFALGDRLLQRQLHGQPLLYRKLQYEITGATGWYVFDMPAEMLKKLAVSLEDSAPFSRLYDMDVLDVDGQKLSREKLGMPRRKCLLCDRDAALCASTRAHGLEALTLRTRELLSQCAFEMTEYIAAQAWLAVNHEFLTTPKPGLVDRDNQGAHKDMTLRHFFASSNALRPFFARFASVGFFTRDADPKETFRLLRPIGIEAEQAMLQATGGINTHKGAIFSLGLLCAALGRLSPELWSADRLCAECAAMAAGVTAEDFAGITPETAKTAGERIYLRYGISGIRGQAEAGFPAVLNAGLPVLQEGLRQGLSLNDAGCAALMHLLTAADDTNLIHRSDRKTQLEIQEQVAALLQNNPYPSREVLQRLDREFIEKNLSPGGSADLLALTYFLHFLTA